jgi:hypothetical protein
MVSAAQSRIKKKEEVLTLNSLVSEKDDQMSLFVTNILVKRLGERPELLRAI